MVGQQFEVPYTVEIKQQQQQQVGLSRFPE